MKYLLLKMMAIIFGISISAKSSGQIEKGKWVSTLGITYDVNKNKKAANTDETKTNNLWISMQLGKFISQKFQLGFGFAPFILKKTDDYTNGSYYHEKRTGYDLYLYGQYFKNIKGEFYFSPLVKLDYYNTKSTFRRKDPGFNETKSTTSSSNYGIELQPLNISYIINKRLILETELGKIIYGYGETKTDAPNSDAAGKGNSFTFIFSPFISNIKISLLF